jgi:hypothetical protein
MSAAEALRAAQAAGIMVTLDGESLLLEAVAEPPQSVLDALARHKRAILDLLRPGQCGWMPEHWQAHLDRHLGIATERGGRTHSEAASWAFACCVVEWLNQHPAPSPPGRCAWCSKSETPSAVVLPFGTEPGTHAWLHAECWPDWHKARQADAIAALAAMGIARGELNCCGNQKIKTARKASKHQSFSRFTAFKD